MSRKKASSGSWWTSGSSVGFAPTTWRKSRLGRRTSSSSDVEQGARVVGPGGGGRRAFDRLGEQVPGGEILHEDRERLRAGRVRRIGEEPVVRAHLERAHPEVGVSGGELVHVQQRLLGGIGLVTMPAEDGILRPGLGPGVVEPAVFARGHRQIRLLDPSPQLLVEPLLETLGVPHDPVGVAVLRLEVGQDFRILAVPEPEVFVDPAFAVNGVHSGNGARTRRLRRRILPDFRVDFGVIRGPADGHGQRGEVTLGIGGGRHRFQHSDGFTASLGPAE